MGQAKGAQGWHGSAASGRRALLLAALLALSPPVGLEATSRPAAEPGAVTLELATEKPAADRFLVRATVGLAASQPSFPLSLHATVAPLNDGDDAPAESFHYVFYRSAAAAEGSVQLPFFRLLPPGAYTLTVTVEDAEGRHMGGASARWAGPPAATHTAAGEEAAGEEAAEAGGLALQPDRGGLLVGTTPIEAQLEESDEEEAIQRVRFWLDGTLAGESDGPPHRVRLDLGPTPRAHTVRAAAYDEAGRRLAAGEIRLNDEPHRFAVRLRQPDLAAMPGGRAVAEAQVEVPDDSPLAHFELFLDQAPLVRLFGPPFLHPLPPAAANASFVRAAATLEDGHRAEDLVLLQGGGNREALDVQLVQLYATVRDRRGRLVSRLGEEDFQILEDGVPQTLHRFEAVSALPLELAVLMDTSRSMVGNLSAATTGAQRFLGTVLRDEDRAAVFTFNHESHLAVPFTHHNEALAAGLENLEAEGETRLYDTLTAALRYFAGRNGRGALLLFSDGEDVSGRHAFKQVIDYARHTGVMIYPIIIDAAGTHTLIKHRMITLARETGGSAFFLTSVSRLDEVYASIESDLRSQYLLAYHSTNPQRDGRFRTVELKARRPGLEVRTRRGYYP